MLRSYCVPLSCMRRGEAAVTVAAARLQCTQAPGPAHPRSSGVIITHLWYDRRARTTVGRSWQRRGVPTTKTTSIASVFISPPLSVSSSSSGQVCFTSTLSSHSTSTSMGPPSASLPPSSKRLTNPSAITVVFYHQSCNDGMGAYLAAHLLLGDKVCPYVCIFMLFCARDRTSTSSYRR